MSDSNRTSSGRRPSTLIIVVVATIIAVLLVFLVGMAASDGGAENDERVDEPEIEVPVERGIPGDEDRTDPDD